MSVTPHDQDAFGSHVTSAGAGVGSGTLERPTSSPGTWTTTALHEVAAQDELTMLCARAAAALSPTARAAVVLVAPPRPPARSEATSAAVATSSPSTAAVVRIEWLLREGPVRTSFASGQPTVSGSLVADARWPRFARAVSGHDTTSAATVPVPLEDEIGRGVLAAYSPDDAAFDARDLRVLVAFAGAVADVVAREVLEAGAADDEEREAARLVNQAIGVLISHHCDEEQAVRRLRRISASTGQSLATAARLIVDEAEVDARLRFAARPPQERVRRP